MTGLHGARGTACATYVVGMTRPIRIGVQIQPQQADYVRFAMQRAELKTSAWT